MTSVLRLIKELTYQVCYLVGMMIGVILAVVALCSVIFICLAVLNDLASLVGIETFLGDMSLITNLRGKEY